MKKLLILCLTLVLTGCACFQKDPVALPDEKKTVDIDKRLLGSCKDVPKLEGPVDTDSQKFSKEVLANYAECAADKESLVKIIKDAFNIK